MTPTPIQPIASTDTPQPVQSAPQSVTYDIAAIKEEARSLIKRGVVDRHQPIYALCRYIPGRDWVCVELELERNDYLLRDRIIDLLGREDWDND